MQHPSFRWHLTPAVSYLEPVSLVGNRRLRCAFTLRHGGTPPRGLNLSFDRGPRAEVQANRHRLLRALGFDHTDLYTVRQVHGNQVCVADAEAVRRGLHGVAADALVTDLPNVPLGVLVADCLPIVLYSLTPSVVAVVHAGRLGTYHRIASQVVTVLQQRFGVDPAGLQAVFGPAIGACCYTLDARAIRPFQQQFPDWETFCFPRGPQRWVMSLTTANARQLRASGIPASHIDAAQMCTACHRRHLYSHRAEGQDAGRGMGLVALLPA